MPGSLDPITDGHIDVVGQVLEMVDKENNMMVISMMADKLKREESSKALPALDKLLKKSVDNSNTAAIACINSLNTFGRPAAKYLIPYVQHQNKNISNAVLRTLSNMSGRNYGDNIDKFYEALFELAT